jgi:hypothetical protein
MVNTPFASKFYPFLSGCCLKFFSHRCFDRRGVYYSNPSVVVLQHVLVETLQLLLLLVGSLSDRSVSREASPRGRTLSVEEATDHPAVAVRVTQMWG